MSSGSVSAFAPGRVNLLGGHADRGGGLALPLALQVGVTVRATPLPGPLIMARTLQPRETDVFDAAEPGEPNRVEGWRAVVRGTAAELATAGHPVRPARIEISGDVPRGSGLASSAALGAALTLALLKLGGVEDVDRREVARMGRRVRERWLDRASGPADGWPALLSVEGHALLIDDAAGTVDTVRADLDGWTLALVPAGVSREPWAARRRDRQRECTEAAERLGVGTLDEADAAAVVGLEEPWRSRALHVLDENDRVRRAVTALVRGDVATLGPLLQASQASLRDRFAVSTPEIDRAVERCLEQGAAGARMVTSGLHGRVLALMPPETPGPRAALVVRPSAGARCW